ncbi:MAG: hypothetical protein AAGF32_05110, partial [Pseudomonadota bacterium]
TCDPLVPNEVRYQAALHSARPGGPGADVRYIGNRARQQALCAHRPQEGALRQKPRINRGKKRCKRG